MLIVTPSQTPVQFVPSAYAAASTSASFIQADVSSQGDWKPIYGTDGYAVVNDSTIYPSYAVVTPSGQSSYTWDPAPTDRRALLKGGSGRIAATWFSATAFQIDINLLDSNIHTIALYMIDWDSTVRAQRIDVLNAVSNQVLDTRSLSGFNGGQYLIWNIAGHVVIKVTRTGGDNAVLSGLFLGGPQPPVITQNPAGATVNVGQTASFTVTATGGGLGYQWQSKPPGSAWANISGASAASYTTPPGLMSDNGAQFRCIATNSSGTATSSAATLAVTVQFPIITKNPTNAAVNLGQTATFTITATGGALSYQWQSKSTGGSFANIAGANSPSYTTPPTSAADNGKQFQIVVTNSVGTATSSTAALTITAGPSASFVQTDTITQGAWKGVYGSDGYAVIGDVTSYPSYAQVTPGGQSSYTWDAAPSDSRALLRAGSGRIAATWYSSTAFQIDVDLPGSNAHIVALYMVDWDSTARAQRIDVLDAGSSQVLDTQSLSSFHGGKYLVWNIAGHVVIKLTKTAGDNTVLSGIFFAPQAFVSSDKIPPTVSLSAPSAGSTVTGTIALSANASDNVGVAGVQFKVDGSNTALEVLSTPFSTVLDTTALANGSHTISATARDLAGNTTISSVTVTVNNPAALKNPIQVENAKTGTAAWKLTSPATNSEIEGYASLTSVNVGGQISFFVNTPDPNYTMDIYRMGWYGGAGARELAGPITLPGTVQAAPTIDPATHLIECRWTSSYVLTVPGAWVSGVYLVKLTASKTARQSYIIFTVRDDARPSDFVFQSSVTTYQAYNNWGGTSLYAYNSSNSVQGTKVSFNRPYAPGVGSAVIGVGAGHFLTTAEPLNYGILEGWEYNAVRWLERQGYDVTYLTDVDVHENGSLLFNHRAFLAVGHDEYWSWNQRQNVENARDRGIHLAFLAANVCYWQIRFEPGFGGQLDRTMTGYKESAFSADPFALDSDPTNDKFITTYWRSNNTKPPEDALVGVAYFADPVNTDLVIVNPSGWIFQSTGLVNGSHLVGLLGYEVDRVMGNAPSNLQILASSPTPAGLDSHMTLYTASSGALVFATGSMQWAWGLDDDYFTPNLRPSLLNTGVQQMTANLLKRFTQ